MATTWRRSTQEWICESSSEREAHRAGTVTRLARGACPPRVRRRQAPARRRVASRIAASAVAPDGPPHQGDRLRARASSSRSTDRGLFPGSAWRESDRAHHTFNGHMDSDLRADHTGHHAGATADGVALAAASAPPVLAGPADSWSTVVERRHLAYRVPFPQQHEGPGTGSMARLTRFSARPRPLERYQPNLPAWS